MEKHSTNQETNPSMRRDFLKAASVLGFGTLAAGALPSFGSVPELSEPKNGHNQMNTGTILAKKRILGAKNNPLTVSAIQLGCMGMHAGRGVHPDHKSMVKLIRTPPNGGVIFLILLKFTVHISTRN